MSPTNVAVNDLVFVVSEPTAEVIARLAAENHWVTGVIEGQSGMLTGPVEIDGWRYEPLQDDYTLPPPALYRFTQILKSGCCPKGIIIGHELDKPAQPLLKVGKIILGLFAAIAFLATAWIVALVLGLALVTALLVGVVVLDPCLILVDEESDQWIVFYRWSN